MNKRAPLRFDKEKMSPLSGMPISKTVLPATGQTPLDEISETTKQTRNQTRKQENTVETKRASKETKTGRAGRQFVAAHILPEAAKQFKLLAVQSDKTTQELLVEAINDLFTKNGLSRIGD
jgi:hypothetical protein